MGGMQRGKRIRDQSHKNSQEGSQPLKAARRRMGFGIFSRKRENVVFPGSAQNGQVEMILNLQAGPNSRALLGVMEIERAINCMENIKEKSPPTQVKIRRRACYDTVSSNLSLLMEGSHRK